MDYARNPSRFRHAISCRLSPSSPPLKPYNRSHMQPALSTRIQDGFMAAMRLGGEKPHQGLPGENPAPNQVREVCKFTVLLGMRGQTELNRAGSCCTGKERDTESGNDYFGARYYASTMGRFMSPDWASIPTPIPYAELANPQTLNLYSYAGNNPLTNRDEDGHVCPKCKTDYAGATKVGGDRSWRNNNPGNMVYGKFAKAHGATGQDSGGFAIFPSMESGSGAQDALWQTSSYSDLSIEDAVKKWTSGDPAAIQAAYAADLAAAAGVPVGTKLSDLTPAQRAKLEAIQNQREGQTPGKVVPKPTPPAPTPAPPAPAPAPAPPPPPPPPPTPQPKN